MTDSTYPNTGSLINRGTADTTEGRTTSGLSTQIIIKVNQVAVGALQNLTVTQARPLTEVKEVGTDGIAEIVPSGATTYDLAVTRVVFDQLRLPEAFSRAFRFIAAQRLPFDIEIFDLNDADDTAETSSGGGVVVMRYVNCWFQNYVTPYVADNYLITETAQIKAETGYISSPPNGFEVPSIRTVGTQTDADGIEAEVNNGVRRGGVDAAGILKAIYSGTT